MEVNRDCNVKYLWYSPLNFGIMVKSIFCFEITRVHCTPCGNRPRCRPCMLTISLQRVVTCGERSLRHEMLYRYVFPALIVIHHVFKLPPFLHLCVLNSQFQLQNRRVPSRASDTLSPRVR